MHDACRKVSKIIVFRKSESCTDGQNLKQGHVLCILLQSSLYIWLNMRFFFVNKQKLYSVNKIRQKRMNADDSEL